MKAKTAKQTVSVPYAWIVNSTDQGRKSIKKGNLVYLQDNTEFKIELFNPLKENVLADIKINSNSISRRGLVLRPGQRFYLDCYLDDRKKFVFKTYSVDNTEESKEAIQNNGIVEVLFYKEDVAQFNNWNSNWNINSLTINPYNPYNIWYGSTTNTGGYANSTLTNGSNNFGIFGGAKYDSSITNCSDTFMSNSSTQINNTMGGTLKGGSDTKNLFQKKFSKSIDINDLSLGLDNSTRSLSDTIETGRIEKGQVSEQKFEDIDLNFQSWTISRIKYQLLPESQKPIETEELKPQPTSTDFYDVLKKLSELHDCGILTDEEFNDKKKEILNKI
jgi:hypothetical protein